MPASDTAQDDLDLLKTAAEKAGEIALSYFRNNPKSWKKAKDSSVSEADMAADAYLKEMLLSARPAYGWLSEETADTAERLDKTHIFVADPIDGTRGFLSGNEDWCVAIAVIENGLPQAAALCAPALGQIYHARRGGGTFCNGKKLNGGTEKSFADFLIAGTPHDAAWSVFRECKKAPFIPSLALRLARVAGGELSAAFARAHAHDWDIAAAHLLVEESGGLLVDAHGYAPRYNRKSLTHPPLGAFGAHTRAQFEQGLKNRSAL